MNSPPFSCRRYLAFFFTAGILSTFALSRAAVQCPAIFSDHMVLQRDRPVTVWGEAAPGEHVRVEFGGNSVQTETGQNGRWRVTLPAISASSEGRELRIVGTTTLTFSDVLVGEVWLCSGQSNMEKPFGPRKGQKPTDDSEREVAAANHPLLRLFQVPHYAKAKADEPLRWVACTPESLLKSQFSAAAYFFGRELRQELNVPIGLIHSSFGGTQIEAWMPASAFSSRPSLAPLVAEKYFAWVEGVQATELYASMISPFVPYTLRGFLWYQGEANCMMAEGTIYTEKMAALIESWRKAWEDPEAPFYYAMLAPFDYSRWDKFPKLLTPEALPIFWEAQAAALSVVPHTGLIVTTDLVANVKDIHPTNKRDVGLRFARLALAGTYGRSQILAHSPTLKSLKEQDGTLEIEFADAGEGLRTRDGAPPSDFIIAGADQNFVPATATLHGTSVRLSNPQVPHPIAARFAWTETAMPNLINSAGLPAVPFRTDRWPVKTERPKPAEAAPAPPVAPAPSAR